MSLSRKHSRNVKTYRKAPSTDVDSDYDDMPNVSEFAMDMEYDSSVPLSGTPQIGHIQHIRAKTSLDTKLKRINEGRDSKKRVKDLKSLKDWWTWYWQHPIGHLPFLYFFLTFVSSFIFSILWFMDNDSCFLLCGLIGLSICSYATYKFKISMALKFEIDKYRQLNLKFKLENIKLEDAINRAVKAHAMLKNTQKRLAKANDQNKKNLKKFEKIEYNMKIIGQKTNLKLTDVNKMTEDIREKWRDEYLDNERQMLHAVFNRYERRHTGKSNLGMTAQDFKEFQSMLPHRYSRRFKRMGTFHEFAGLKSMIDIQDFSNTLDVFAEMETDDRDIHICATPKGVQHNREVSSFNFRITDLRMDGDASPVSAYASPQLSPYMTPKMVPQLQGQVTFKINDL